MEHQTGLYGNEVCVSRWQKGRDNQKLIDMNADNFFQRFNPHVFYREHSSQHCIFQVSHKIFPGKFFHPYVFLETHVAVSRKEILMKYGMCHLICHEEIGWVFHISYN